MPTKPEIKQFNIFNDFPHLIHGFSTRKGGVSRPPFHYLNLGLSTSDDKQLVQKNRQIFFSELKVAEEALVIPQQVHSAQVKIVKRPGVISSCDGLISQQKNLFLTVQTADCFPIFIYDPQKEVVAIVHSGWRGTAQNIVGKTVQKMLETFRCSPKDLLIAIGPGVQQSCYQIDEKTARFFDESFLVQDGPGHYKLDLQGNIVFQLQNQGVPLQNIEWDQTCTHCAIDEYFSYRRDGLKSGRMMGIIGIVQ